MGNYANFSYHQLRRMYGDVPTDDKAEVLSLIVNYYRKMIERSLKRQHPDRSAGEIKGAVFERIYRDDFSPDEMVRIKASTMAYEARQSNP